MTNQEAIEAIKLARSQVEWDYPMDYAAAFDKAIEALEQEPTLLSSELEKNSKKLEKDFGELDCIGRTELLKAMDTWDKFGYTAQYGFERLDKDDKGFVPYVKYEDMVKCVKGMPSVTPQPRKGQWLRMSDLSEQEDNRYKCSRCGNVVRSTNKMNLYTFNSWCGRCGSDNGRHINYEVEE